MRQQSAAVRSLRRRAHPPVTPAGRDDGQGSTISTALGTEHCSAEHNGPKSSSLLTSTPHRPPSLPPQGQVEPTTRSPRERADLGGRLHLAVPGLERAETSVRGRRPRVARHCASGRPGHLLPRQVVNADLRTHVPLRVEFEDFDVPGACAHRDKVSRPIQDSSLHDTTTTVASILRRHRQEQRASSVSS